jgi:hypothetical protein
MSSELVISSARHEAAIQRVMSTSKRTAVEVLKGEAKLVFTEVAKVTPPSHTGVTGRTAEKHAKTKIAAEIYSLYGGPDDAYDAIAEKSPAKASAFWYLHKHDETADANAILREATGSILYPFDGGVHHRRNFKKSAKRKRGFTFFVSNPQSLDSYVQQEQSHVWWLASGWEDALTALGAKLPYGVGKLNAPGSIKVDITNDRITITMGNDVKYARQVRDIERRIKWAMEIRADRMQKNWDNYISRIAGESGMKKV